MPGLAGPWPHGLCPHSPAKGLLPRPESSRGKGALGTEAAGWGGEGKRGEPSASGAANALSRSGAKGFLPFESSEAKGGGEVAGAGEAVMFSEPGTWTFRPVLEMKGLLSPLVRCTERKAGRESGARAGSVAWVSSSEVTPGLQKGTKNSHVTGRYNTRHNRQSFSTGLHQLLTLGTNSEPAWQTPHTLTCLYKALSLGQNTPAAELAQVTAVALSTVPSFAPQAIST